MAQERIDIKSLDNVFNRMVETIDNSKTDIFTISEQSRSSFEEMKLELEDIRLKLKNIIEENDLLEEKSKAARQYLSEVSRDFNIYTETQVKEAYERANEIQIQHTIIQSNEKTLRERRDDLERRMRSLLDTIEKADHLANQVNVVLNYLTYDLKEVGPALENAKLKEDFTIKIIEATEEERKRISREIHDGPAQMLANVLLRTDLINRTFNESGVQKALEEIVSLKGMIRDALHEVRRIIYDLRPMALDDLGIVPTLKKYLHSVEEYNPTTEIHFNSLGEAVRLQTNYEVAIFRLVQECINNAIKHGKSTEIIVTFIWKKDHVVMSIKDNGSGFDPKQSKRGSFGLMGMRERVELLNGKMEIQSAPEQGTAILVTIPISPKQEINKK